jgi:hypothetical protein
MSTSRQCCCGGTQCERDCLFSSEIDSGCCHNQETLVLWCERPGYTISQHYRVQPPIPGSQACEINYTETTQTMEPVQAIYRFHSCRYVLRFADAPVQLVTMPEYDNVAGEACKDPCCFPQYANDICCQTQVFNPTCLCGTWFGAGIGGLSNSRKDDLAADPASQWFIDLTCHKNGQDLAFGVNRLYDQFLCMVFYERWWKIADECAPATRIYVPGCDQTSDPSNCGGIPFQEDDLVPKWWHYACSGIPLLQTDLDDALSFGIITSGEYDELIQAITLSYQPNQSILQKLADAGIIAPKDWRPEQRQAFLDLKKKFPGAGYEACVQAVEDMHELGPFRKRYCDPTVGTNNSPILHKDDVFADISGLQADCMIDYPGGASDQAEYDYWRERQWVYFRAVPGGWAWSGWNSTDGYPGLTEEEAIAQGFNRNVGIGGPEVLTTPMIAFRGQPMNPALCASGAAVCPEPTVFCNICIDDCSDCGAAPLQACDPPENCRKFTIRPTCEGIRFVYSQYYWRNTLDQDCIAGGEYVCVRSVKSYLVGAKRTRDSWSDSIPFTCRDENPDLPAFNGWPVISYAHFPPDPMCAEIVEPVDPNNPQYDVNDLCCGGYCLEFPLQPCPQGGANACPTPGPHNDCGAVPDCPPHDTPAQEGCIGHQIECDP